ncbi:hypothetical protein OROMI_011977 [Orobanche minor]
MLPRSSETSINKAPLKPWKHLLPPPFKPTFPIPYFTKALLAILIFALLSFYYYVSFLPGSKWRFPDTGHDPFVRASDGPDSITNEEKTNVSHILFGIGGSAKTWLKRRHYSELWWEPNITRGFVWLDEKPAKWLEVLLPLVNSPGYKVSADTARFNYTCKHGSRSAVRIARILKESFELGEGNVRWFVMGDDDTVFFTENLVSVLSRYDHREMYYIGSNSESVEQLTEHSYTMAYGGAGFAISYPLAAELVRILDGCINRYAESYGSDVKIEGCMTEIGVPLTKELGFHQLDIRGNALGLLSAHPLAPLVSLHHLDYVEPLFPNTSRVASVKKLIQAYESDPSRALQHSFCYDLTRNWSISVSWGYTVQLYPFLIRPKELSMALRTFLTWGKSKGQFTFNTRTFKPEPCGRPVVYYFDGVDNFGNGNTLSWYKRLGDDQRKKCDNGSYKGAYMIKRFSVSAPLFDTQLWNKSTTKTVVPNNEWLRSSSSSQHC